MDFRLAPDVNIALRSFFLNFFWSLGPRIDTHGNFIIFLVFLVLFWSLLFGLLMFRKYSVAMLVSVFLLYSLSVKMYFILGTLSITCFVCSWKKTFEYSHSNMRCYVWIWFYLFICYWCFPKGFEIIKVITSFCDSYIKRTELLVFIFEFNRVLYWWILFVQDV